MGRWRPERSLHASSPPVVALFEHILACRVQGPVVALSLTATLPRHLDEALVERQVVSDAVLPSFLVLLVERKLADDVLVDTGQRETLFRALADRHRD